ncbi:MAG: hypothetical protein S4CHLAM20_01540 [Chlamydiia bacterium]|nr:hypothetical protein [Chlamydiia bacterium]
MGKFFKILIAVVVFIVIIFGAIEYFDFYKVGDTAVRHRGCKKFTTHVDSKSKEKVAEIITTMANTSTVGLAFKANHLRALGKEIDKKVPSPLTFLYIIFSDQKLANDMKIVKQSSYKYDNFCEGLYPNMQMDYGDKKCFKDNVYLFAKALKINQEKTYNIAETCGKQGESGNKDAFKPFVDYLIQQKAH